jgi:hypothetical protein
VGSPLVAGIGLNAIGVQVRNDDIGESNLQVSLVKPAINLEVS